LVKEAILARHSTEHRTMFPTLCKQRSGLSALRPRIYPTELRPQLRLRKLVKEAILARHSTEHRTMFPTLCKQRSGLSAYGLESIQLSYAHS